MDAWCSHCARDKAWNGEKDFYECAPEELCEIIGGTQLYELSDPEYPKEWIYNAEGVPTCTAFVCLEKDIPERCEHTEDMFS